ncbi:LamG-like jellyroll fold domain-containing protein [Granulicella arctica]|uniref:LamG-like jellyroll fold domain-containing protein n=1 Tax=Granulicella arctica TaxID=940613 RepID=A0A7Y9PJL3_9BACT|nr:LamG-like jellyroll fold domain-containing protein [Granulicella arctica]NYF80268.1 hypothetical protein [Granulicella arctica]
MKKSKSYNACTRIELLPPSAPEHDPTMDDGLIDADLSRRGFLHSLAALALTACGGVTFASQPKETSGNVSGPFTHPGLMHTRADFVRMTQKCATSPWAGSWKLLVANPKVTLSYSSAPVSVIYRGNDVAQNFSRLYNECAAMYGMALRWKITGDAAYAAKATSMLNGWVSTLTSIQGRDRALVSGPQGFELANIAEMLRDYRGFTDGNLTAVKKMLRNIFYPISHELLRNHGGRSPLQINANWYLFNMSAIMAIGILCDDRAMFDEAVDYFKTGNGNGSIKRAAYYMHPGYLCQWQESGRDQVHTMDGIAAMAALCEMAWHQGVDLYGYDNNRFLAGAEYSAKANVIASGTTYYNVPYVSYRNGVYTWDTFSTIKQGDATPCWAIIYNHYVNRKGLAAPYSTKKALAIQPEGGEWDFIGYGTLAYTLDAIPTGAAPSGLSGYVSAGAVVLSWWGGVYATDYTVKRSAVAGGPYTAVASRITDLLTYTDTPPSPGTWYYIVTANTRHSESVPSNEVAVSTGIQLHTHLKFDNTSSESVADASGNGHTGTLNGGATCVADRQGHALSLNGSNGYVDLPSQLMHDVADFTVSAWVFWNASRNWERIFDFGAGLDRYLMLTPCASSGVVRFSMTVTGASGERVINGHAALPTGTWVHVAVTLSGRVGTLYVNGVAVGSNTDMFLAPFRIWDSNQNWIGRSQYSSNPYFNGKIDDFRIYRGALSADDVASLAKAP